MCTFKVNIEGEVHFAHSWHLSKLIHQSLWNLSEVERQYAWVESEVLKQGTQAQNYQMGLSIMEHNKGRSNLRYLQARMSQMWFILLGLHDYVEFLKVLSRTIQVHIASERKPDLMPNHHKYLPHWSVPHHKVRWVVLHSSVCFLQFSPHYLL